MCGYGADDGGYGLSKVDSGADYLMFHWRRYEGCGTVQFQGTDGNVDVHFYNFDATTGEFIGVARVHNAYDPAPAKHCDVKAYVAGQVKASCVDDQRKDCLSL